MQTLILAFFLGVSSLQLFPTLPALAWSLLLIPFCWARIPRAFVLGFFWALLYAHLITAWTLPNSQEAKNIVVTGYVASLPENQHGCTTFNFDIGPIIKLSWYKHDHPIIHAGDQWKFTVRLKRPHGTLNPGGFDFEEYAFEHHIRAVGYIVDDANNLQLSSHWYRYPLLRVREALRAKIANPIIAALVVGDEGGVSSAEWQVLRDTGTSYLLAISGLHIGLAASVVFFLVNFLWRRFTKLSLLIPASEIATIAGLITAVFYSFISGMSLPTQRALTMIIVFSGLRLLRRNSSPWQALFLALFAVLVFDPLAELSVGFWLSFAAVAVIIYVVCYRLQVKSNWWCKYWRMQFAITLALLPITLFWFQQFSWLSLIANIIALPGVCLIVVPLCLIATVLGHFGAWLFWCAAKIMSWIWLWLAWLAHFSLANWYQSIFNYWILFAAFIGAILLLAPRGWPRRWLGIIWFLPLFFYTPAGPSEGEVWFTLLDVGQGLASVVRTSQHVLVYDTGPKLFDSDAGANNVVPFLRASGIKKIDLMMVSHGDADHIGGANSIIHSIYTAHVLTSVPERFPVNLAEHCHVGQEWQWDGVNFQVLSPQPNQPYLGNNSSCVLKINDGANSVLLTGDMESDTENFLLQTQGANLHSTILVAPHHGSATSSTLPFVDEVLPQYVLFPVGYLNRFHFPAPSVVNRYSQVGANLLQSAATGAITFKFSDKSAIMAPALFRNEARKYRDNL